MLNYLLLWEGVRSLHLLSDPNAVCCCCLKRSLLSIFLLEVRKTIFQSTLPAFLGILLNLRRRLRIWWSGETCLDLEKNKPRGGKGGRTLLETSLGSWRPSRDACLTLFQQLFSSSRAKAAPCPGASALSGCEGRGEPRCREERPGSASGSARVRKAPQG